MYGELASIRGIVDLSPEEALDSAETFLAGQDYRIVRRTATSLTANRPASRPASGASAPVLTVAVQSQPAGGVKISIRGTDQEGMQERQAEWLAWSEGLPRKPESPLETPNLPMPAPPQPQAPVLPEPPAVPTVAVPPPPRQEGSTVWRGTKLAFGGCIVLPLLLVAGLVGCLALVGGLGGFDENAPPASPGGLDEPAVSSVIVRVSGSPGLRYSGNYGTAEGGGRTVDGELSVSPTEYQVPVKSGAFEFDMVTAVFQKMDAEGTLRVEIIVDGQVVKAQETVAQYGVVDVSYSPQVD